MTTAADADFQTMADNINTISVGKRVVDLGSSATFNLSSYPEYKSFTSSNFILSANSINTNCALGYDPDDTNPSGNANATIEPRISYNNSTGIGTIINTGMGGSTNTENRRYGYYSTSVSCRVYLIY